MNEKRMGVENQNMEDEPGSDKPGGAKQEIEKPRAIKQFSHNWSTSCKNAIKSVEELAKFLPLDETEKETLRNVTKTYHIRITDYYLSLIQNPYDKEDPIRKQCVPDVQEIQEGVYEKLDPLGEMRTSPLKCLVHRYPDRALLIVTNRCFMYCRHCTRKRIWGKNIPEPTLQEINRAVDYLRVHREIREVIVSGGDPFILPTEKLDYILSLLSKVESLEVIRIGTRTPVVFPERIDDSLCRMLEKYENLWVNTQFNHPREITAEARLACRKLQKAGIPMSNQSVLLKGVNDNPEVMLELCHTLQSIRVRPYYLFECDAVVGAAHFRTSIFKGVEIIEKMRGHTGGMCVPTFVVDGEDGKGKIPLQPNYLLSLSEEGVTLRNYKNETFFYPNPK